MNLSGFEYGGKGAAVAGPAFDFEVAVMFGQGVFGDGKAKAGAAVVAGAAGIDAVEALGQARQVFGGDAGAGVAYAETDVFFTFALQADADVAACGRVADGVEYQVAEGVVEVELAAVYPDIGRYVGGEGVAALRE